LIARCQTSARSASSSATWVHSLGHSARAPHRSPLSTGSNRSPQAQPGTRDVSTNLSTACGGVPKHLRPTLAEVLAQIPQRLGSSRQPNSGSGQLTMPDGDFKEVRACRSLPTQLSRCHVRTLLLTKTKLRWVVTQSDGRQANEPAGPGAGLTSGGVNPYRGTLMCRLYFRRPLPVPQYRRVAPNRGGAPSTSPSAPARCAPGAKT
jgi:hypothetical protein